MFERGGGNRYAIDCNEVMNLIFRRRDAIYIDIFILECFIYAIENDMQYLIFGLIGEIGDIVLIEQEKKSLRPVRNLIDNYKKDLNGDSLIYMRYICKFLECRSWKIKNNGSLFVVLRICWMSRNRFLPFNHSISRSNSNDFFGNDVNLYLIELSNFLARYLSLAHSDSNCLLVVEKYAKGISIKELERDIYYFLSPEP